MPVDFDSESLEKSLTLALPGHPNPIQAHEQKNEENLHDTLITLCLPTCVQNVFKHVHLLKVSLRQKMPGYIGKSGYLWNCVAEGANAMMPALPRQCSAIPGDERAEQVDARGEESVQCH
jgi:hypothetical protein